MYVCGPTVYNFIHIGNARPMIVFDTVRRYMEYKGYEVNFVSNFTDVDDKIIKKAISSATVQKKPTLRMQPVQFNTFKQKLKAELWLIPILP